MKKTWLIIAFLPLFTRAQNAYTVCNASGVTANFATLQGAIDSVASGSTIYVLPSRNDYGNVTLSKKLSIYGTGFMLDQNSGYYTTPNVYGVTLTSMTFAPGSDNSYAEGLQMIGLTPSQSGQFRFYLDSVANITISRCLTDTYFGFGGNTALLTKSTFNCSFNGCYLYLNNLNNVNHSAGGFYMELGNGSQDLAFNNNIIDSRGYSTALSMSAQSGGFGTITFTNNTIVCGVPGSVFANAMYINNFIINTVPTGSFTAASVSMNGPAINNITNTPNLFPAPTAAISSTPTRTAFSLTRPSAIILSIRPGRWYREVLPTASGQTADRWAPSAVQILTCCRAFRTCPISMHCLSAPIPSIGAISW